MTDSTNAALPNAILKVVNLASGKENSAHTNNAGQYTIKGLASGIYRISVQVNNVHTDSGSANISPSIVDVSQLDSVEVLSSVGLSLYGSDALAGIVNL